MAAGEVARGTVVEALVGWAVGDHDIDLLLVLEGCNRGFGDVLGVGQRV